MWHRRQTSRNITFNNLKKKINLSSIYSSHFALLSFFLTPFNLLWCHRLLRHKKGSFKNNYRLIKPDCICSCCIKLISNKINTVNHILYCTPIWLYKPSLEDSIETIMRSSMGNTPLYVLLYVTHSIVEWQKKMITYFNIYSPTTARLEKTLKETFLSRHQQYFISSQELQWYLTVGQNR